MKITLMSPKDAGCIPGHQDELDMVHVPWEATIWSCPCVWWAKRVEPCILGIRGTLLGTGVSSAHEHTAFAATIDNHSLRSRQFSDLLANLHDNVTSSTSQAGR